MTTAADPAALLPDFDGLVLGSGAAGAVAGGKGLTVHSRAGRRAALRPAG